MGCRVVVYVGVLVIDLLLGCAMILWKCVFSEDDVGEECKLVTGGTLGSLLLWLLVMLICPCVATKVDRENCTQKLSRYIGKFYPRKTRREVYIESAVYRPTTVAIEDSRVTKTTDLPGDNKKVVTDTDTRITEQLLQTERNERPGGEVGGGGVSGEVVYIFTEMKHPEDPVT